MYSNSSILQRHCDASLAATLSRSGESVAAAVAVFNTKDTVKTNWITVFEPFIPCVPDYYPSHCRNPLRPTIPIYTAEEIGIDRLTNWVIEAAFQLSTINAILFEASPLPLLDITHQYCYNVGLLAEVELDDDDGSETVVSDGLDVSAAPEAYGEEADSSLLLRFAASSRLGLGWFVAAAIVLYRVGIQWLLLAAAAVVLASIGL